MKESTPIIIIFAAVCMAGALMAQDVTGTWQGTITLQEQGTKRDLRAVFKISKENEAGLTAILYSIDQGNVPSGGTVTLQGRTVKISVPEMKGLYEGKLDMEGFNLTGTWAQGTSMLPLNLRRVSEREAWAIPEPPARLKPMAADADPAFDVVSIKPSNPDARGKKFGLASPRVFSTSNTSLNDLIVFSYGLHQRQIVGGPAWIDSATYDISGKADGEGRPSLPQWKTMFQKMLADRFQLTFHREKKTLSVYAIVVGKNGPKLTRSAAGPNDPISLVFRGPGDLPAKNVTMAQFAGTMQTSLLDRPVVDKTGISGRYDFQLRWAPDEKSISGAQPPVEPANMDPLPDLFTAIQQQLGLKLQSSKATVDILVIDHSAKPAQN